MRGMECVVPNCGHLHASTDEQLIDAVVRHAREAHPDLTLDTIRARSLVTADAYDDVEHRTRKTGWSEFVGGLGQSGTG